MELPPIGRSSCNLPSILEADLATDLANIANFQYRSNICVIPHRHTSYLV